jgi:hypothetical protein
MSTQKCAFLRKCQGKDGGGNVVSCSTNLYSPEKRGFYYRGEIEDFKTTTYLPPYLRGIRKTFSSNALDNEMLKQKLEELGIGFPYTPPLIIVHTVSLLMYLQVPITGRFPGGARISWRL